MNSPVFSRYLRENEERQLLRYVAQFDCPLAKRDHAWMRVARHSAIRVGSLVRLSCNDAREALRTHQLGVRSEIAKGKRGYTVFANKKCRQALLELLSIRRALGLAEDPDAPLIVGRTRKGVTTRALQKRMAQWCEAAGLTVSATPHWWRHTKAKRIINASSASEADRLLIAQRHLGHATVKSTAIYTQPDRDDYEQLVEES